VLKEPTSFN